MLKFTQNQNSEPLILQRIIILDHLNSPKFDVMENLSDGKMLKFQQSQALTSHFESFWGIVDMNVMHTYVCLLISLNGRQAGRVR